LQDFPSIEQSTYRRNTRFTCPKK